MSARYVTHADLGGTDRHGAIVGESENDRFHADWERRALALTLAMGATGAWNIDMSRAARETLPEMAGFAVADERRYGKAKIVILRGAAA